jgi:site-specific DNA-methyltransferase (adenine-specific)
MEVMKYGKYNWIRLWLLGHEASEIDKQLVSTSSLQKYIDFNGYMCLVLGDVRRGEHVLNLAPIVAEEVVKGTGLNVAAIVADEIPIRHKVSRIWKDSRVRATKVDRILILRGPDAPALPRLPRIEWRRTWTSSRS